MPRIRSVHPSLWTDEAFVSLSMPARLFYIGLWTEADDQGVFQWKPLSLKMRLLPADNVDAEVLLSELLENQLVTSYDIDGKGYGLVRNFTKFQRPKKPNAIHPLPPEFPTSSELVPHQFPTSGENPPQMEDGGGSKEKDTITPDGVIDAASRVMPDESLKDQIWGPCLRWLAKQSEKPPDKLRPLLGKWCKAHGEGAVLEAMQRAERQSPVDPVSWLAKALQANGGGSDADVLEMMREAAREADRRNGIESGS